MNVVLLGKTSFHSEKETFLGLHPNLVTVSLPDDKRLFTFKLKHTWKYMATQGNKLQYMVIHGDTYL